MQKTILFIALLASASVPAFARDIVSFSCESKRNGFGDVTLTVTKFWMSDDKKEGTMRDVYMTVSRPSEQSATGRTKTLDSDANYRPTKYKKHLRFDMSKLTDVTDFDSFTPSGCSIKVMVPDNVMSSRVSRMEVPVTLTCDEEGNSIFLDCFVATVRE
ncbi:MAG TPA: hypothetical protein VIH99_00420 [Bdellovibrionota bacterium]|jgi:hypothetical protein